MARKAKPSDWMNALMDQKLEVKTASDASTVVGYLDSGNYALNWAISGRLLRGYPLGHTIEIFGDPSTGKSFLLARAIAMCQKEGGVALLDDVEGGHTAPRLANSGVDVLSLPVKRSRTVRSHLEVATGFVNAFKASKQKGPGVLGCDSIAELSTEHELEVRLTKKDMTKAAEMKAFFRIMGADLGDIPVAYICTNHTIASPGNYFNPRTTPGGGGPKFHSTVRIDMRATKRIKQGDEVVGVLCRAHIEKNRLFTPWKETRLAIPFHEPISRASGLVPLLIGLGILEVEGNYVVYDDQRVGRFSKKDALKQDALAEELLDKYPEILEHTDGVLESGGSVRMAARVLDEYEDESEEVAAE